MHPNLIEQYNIRLLRLNSDNIELVRNWRNSPKIQQTMIYREYISPAMQIKWFNKINNDDNLYYIIESEQRKIGLINVKDISFIDNSGESGVFIFDDESLGKDIAYRAHLCFFDYVFNCTKIENLYAHILSNNSPAIRFVQFLGYKIDSYKSNSNVIFVTLSKSDYLQNNNRARFIKKWNFFNSKNYDK